MRFRRRLAHFNKSVTNRVQGQWAWLLPPWAVVLHKGRRSGREYRTPVMALLRGGQLKICVLYGTESDWVQNLLAAGGGEVVRCGRTYRFTEPRVEGGVLVASLGDRVSGRTRRGMPSV